MKEFFGYLRDQIQANPTIIKETVVQFVILAGVFGIIGTPDSPGLITLTSDKHDTLISVISGLSALWLRNQVIPTVYKNREVEKSVLHREAVGTTGTSIGMGEERPASTEASINRDRIDTGGTGKGER